MVGIAFQASVVQTSNAVLSAAVSIGKRLCPTGDSPHTRSSAWGAIKSSQNWGNKTFRSSSQTIWRPLKSSNRSSLIEWPLTAIIQHLAPMYQDQNFWRNCSTEHFWAVLLGRFRIHEVSACRLLKQTVLFWKKSIFQKERLVVSLRPFQNLMSNFDVEFRSTFGIWLTSANRPATKQHDKLMKSKTNLLNKMDPNQSGPNLVSHCSGRFGETLLLEENLFSKPIFVICRRQFMSKKTFFLTKNSANGQTRWGITKWTDTLKNLESCSDQKLLI